MPSVSNKTIILERRSRFFLLSFCCHCATPKLLLFDHSPNDTTRQIERHSNVGRKLSRFNFVHHHFLFVWFGSGFFGRVFVFSSVFKRKTRTTLKYQWYCLLAKLSQTNYTMFIRAPLPALHDIVRPTEIWLIEFFFCPARLDWNTEAENYRQCKRKYATNW